VSLPDNLEIIPLEKPPSATIRVPGSKSITNRALVLGALSESGCTLIAAQRSEDTEVMIGALRALGWNIEAAWERNRIRIEQGPASRIIRARHAGLFVANSGTSMRFLTALVCLGCGRYRLDGIARMRERPIEDLLTALRQLGVDARSEAGNGCPPVVIETTGLMGGHVRIKGDVSSQFLSALLMAVPLAQGDTNIEIEGSIVSRPYVDMTVSMMRYFGARIEITNDGFLVAGKQRYRQGEYTIGADASAASYFYGAAAITCGTVCVDVPSTPWQGDLRFVEELRYMGCKYSREDKGLVVHGRPLHGIDVDMNDISDTVMTLAAVACFAEGPTTIRNVAHIRHKETDRLTALATELRRVGAEVDEYPDGLKITPRPLRGAEIETYNDHRMAMSMALIGLKVPGIVIKNPGCVAKTYPGFFADLEKLR
jgi:3-phosphoshikimate 1-carboxyvinyltransferase